MDNIGGSIETLQRAIKGRLSGSGIQPLVLPQACPFREITDFFTDAGVKQAVDSWVERHNPEHVVFIAEVDYSELTIFINEVRVVSHEDIELYNLEGMIKIMTIGDSAELKIYMDRFASSKSLSGGKSIARGARKQDDSDSGDSDDSGVEARSYSAVDSGDLYYHSRGLMNEVFSMAYSLKVLISNISGWSFALRPKKTKNARVGKGDSEGVADENRINLPIDSSNIKKCLDIINSLVSSGDDSKSDIGSKNSNSSSNKGSSKNSMNGGDMEIKSAGNDSNDDSDDISESDVDDSKESSIVVNKMNKSIKKRKRKRGGGK
jgi:hypothetical protein